MFRHTQKSTKIPISQIAIPPRALARSSQRHIGEDGDGLGRLAAGVDKETSDLKVAKELQEPAIQMRRYHLVMTNSLPWLESPINGGF